MDVEGGGPCRVDSAAGPRQNFSMLCRWQFEVHAFASASRQLQRKNQSTHRLRYRTQDSDEYPRLGYFNSNEST